jgi:hypothetical protein
VAGIYDADARTLDVYLNGNLDDGLVVGTVTGRRRSSRSAVYIGRRADLKGFEFAGSIDGVRIYPFALTKEEVVADMHGEVIQRGTGRNNAGDLRDQDAACGDSSEYEASKMPGAATLGVVVAIACLGFWPSGTKLACVAASFAAGLLFLPLMASSLPPLSRWMMPLVSLAGDVSIAVSSAPPGTNVKRTV